MPPPLVDPATGAIMGEALSKLLDVVKIIASSKIRGKELKEKLESLKPIIDQICQKLSDPDRANQFKDFQVVLQDGLVLVEKLEKIHSFDIIRKYQYGKKIRKFQKKVSEFLHTHGPPSLILDLQKLDADFNGFCQRFEGLIESLIQNVIARMTNDPISNTIRLQQMNNTAQVFPTSMEGMNESTAAQQAISCTYQVPDMPNFVVGLDKPIDAVKKILLQNGVNIVGITGMGGSGKTTLASAVCNDTQVRDRFKTNIFFIPVSQLERNANGLLDILEVMWDKIIGGHRPHFQSIEDAHNQLHTNLRLTLSQATLVVLDDVWPKPNVEQLLFEVKGYKTIITTREESNIFITGTSRQLYKLPVLKDADALSLFCFWAFSQKSIPATEKEDLVKQVAKKCKGLPLALKVIASSLHGESRPVWERAEEKLSRAEHISQAHIDDLYNRLEMSIDILEDEQKQCFLDLGAFPKSRKFSIDSLLDIWVYVRGMEWRDAFVVLLELAKRNLLNLTSYPGNGAIEYSCASELFFSQHDVMRDLAFRLASQDSIIHRKRLFMPCKEDNIPTKWLNTQPDQKYGAQFLAFHTGEMQEQAWRQIDFPFPEVEALALFFAADHYCLPTFLQIMPKLKVLIVYNYSSKRTILGGLLNFPSPVQIRSVLLNKLIVQPPLYNNCRAWERLEKLHVCLCEGLGNIILLDKENEHLNFPKMVEINIDHCSDLRELPTTLCNLTSLQNLSVTNCHFIQNLPDGLGSLSSLRVLRLSACPSLSKLPPSICNLGKLEYLDISQCGYLKYLPSKFDELSKLETLDMRECSGLKKQQKVKLKSLKRVIISYPQAEREWLSIPNLTVEVVPERFSLDWLDD